MTQTRASNLLGALCLLIWLGLLGFGLWPFDFFPRNKVTWLGDRNGIHFDHYGEIYSSTAANFSGSSTSQNRGSYSVELWLYPWAKNYPQFSAVFSIDHPKALNFSIVQSGPDLLVRGRFLDKNNSVVIRKLWMDDACRKGEPRFITFTSGPDDSAIYLEGILQKRYPFVLTSDSLSGQLLLGHPPTGHQSWSGDVLGFAIYDRALTADEISKHYDAWQQGKTADLAAEKGLAALYAFDERSGDVIHNRAGSAPDLIIPSHFKLLHPEILSTELDITLGGLQDIVVNILGLVPFGFFGYAYLRHARRLGKVQSAIIVIALGGITSLAIELLQVHLPSRYSSLLDVIDNTLGTTLGVIAFSYLTTWVSWTKEDPFRL
jgi:VanZ like family/Concanavalin A-like lectin/glucanases superfamily